MKTFTDRIQLTQVLTWDDAEAGKLTRQHWKSGTVNTQGDRDVFVRSLAVKFDVGRFTTPEDLNSLVKGMEAIVVFANKDGSFPKNAERDGRTWWPSLSVHELSPELRTEIFSELIAMHRDAQAKLNEEA